MYQIHKPQNPSLSHQKHLLNNNQLSKAAKLKVADDGKLKSEECLGIASELEISGTVVVTDDGWGIAEQLCILLEEKGLDAVRIGFESEIRDMSEQSEGKRTVYRADPANIEHIRAVCAELNSLQVGGVIHLAALKLGGFEWDEDTYPSSQITMAASGWFALLKGLDAKLANLKSD